ncbi:MAG: paraquat-inducible protein A [Campylobacterota bacterium]
MSFDTSKIIECYGCGLFVNKWAKKKSKVLKCPRCNSTLIMDNIHSYDSLYYAISSLLVYIFVCIYPILTLDVNNAFLKATLIDTVYILFEKNFFFVGVVVLFTIVVAPLFTSFVILFSFLQNHTKVKIFTSTLLHDSFLFFKHWAFIDVFIISIIVTYIKLISMSDTTTFAVGFYALLFYLFCFYMSIVKFERKTILGE